VQAILIRGGEGKSGANLDYLVNTLRHLGELGIRERALERLIALVGAFAARRAGGGHVSPAARAMLRAARSLPPLVHRRQGKDRDRRFLYRLRVGG
jgi:cation transport protein ChaC